MRVRDILLKWRLPLVALFAAALFVALAYLAFADKKYDAEAKLQVVPLAADDRTFDGFSLFREGEDEETAAATAADLVESSEVVDAVDERLGPTRDELLRAVHATTQGASNVVTVRARWSNAQVSAQIANAFADEFVARRSARFQSELTRTIGRLRAESRSDDVAARIATLQSYVGQPDPTIEVASDAVAPADHSRPRPGAVFAWAFGVPLLAAVLAVGAAVLLSRREAPPKPVAVPEPAPTPVAPPEPAPETEPETQSEPEPVAQLAAPGVWSLPRLERLVEERGAEFPDRVEEWRSYLFLLRDHASPEGRLPASFDALVDEVFEELL